MGIKTAISSKQYGFEKFLSELVADACLNSMPENANNFIVDNLRTVKILGSTVTDSFVIRGMVIETRAKSITKKKENTKIAIFTCPFESSQTETKGTVLLHNAQELLNYNKSEEEHLQKIVLNLRDMGVGVIVVGDQISEMALHFMDKYEIVCLKLVSKWTLRRLCRASNARPIVQLVCPFLFFYSLNSPKLCKDVLMFLLFLFVLCIQTAVRPEDLGHCAKVDTREIGSDTVTVFSQVGLGESLVSTIVIRGATSTVLQDIERAIDDGVNMVRAMTKNGKFVAGAGACEIELARQLTKFAANTPGLEQYAIEKYGEALEVVPRTLAENTGLNDSEIISKLYKSHETGQSLEKKDEDSENEDNSTGDDDRVKTGGITSGVGSNFGVDIINGGVKDMTKEGVIDLMATRQMGLKLATNAATTILRVDHIIMKKVSIRSVLFWVD